MMKICVGNLNKNTPPHVEKLSGNNETVAKV